MSRTFSRLTLAACVFFDMYLQAVTRDIIPAGTILQCTLDEPNFSSKTALVGDPVLCHLSSLSSFGHPLFPRGAMLSGHLEDYKNPGHFVGKGWIKLEFDRIVLPDAEVLPIAAKIISAHHGKVDKEGDIHGKGHPKRDVVEWMIPILWPLKVITLPARGPYPSLKGETRIALRLMEDVEFPPPVARNSVPMPPWVTPSSYHPSGYNASLQPGSTLNQVSSVQPVTSTAKPQESASPKTTIIALKGGAAFLAARYWIQDGQMHCISSSGEERLLPLEKIDLTETTRVNQERSVDFGLQSRDVLEQ